MTNGAEHPTRSSGRQGCQRLRRRWPPLALLALACLVAAVILEGAARVALRSRTSTLRVQFPAMGWTEVHQYDPDLMWSLRRNIENAPQYIGQGEDRIESVIRTNALGLRSPAIRPKGTQIRILALGASSTFGAGVNNEDTWPAQLQAVFDSEAPDAVEVINAGVSAYTAYQGLRYLEIRGLELEPNIVIACFGHNDQMPAPPEGIGDAEWGNPTDAFAVVELVEEAIRGAARMVSWKPFGERTMRLSVGEYADTLVRMDGVCRLAGARLAHLYSPFRWEAEEPSAASLGKPFTLGAAAFTETPVIDLLPAVKDCHAEAYFDDCHMTVLGNRRAAQYIAAELKRLFADQFETVGIR